MATSAPALARAADETVETAGASVAAYKDGLRELAAWCDRHGLAAEAEKTRGLIPPEAPDRIYVPILPTAIRENAAAETFSTAQKEWSQRLATLRRAHANKLFALAKTAHRRRRTSLALDLALAALRADPDHEPLRRLFGYRRYKNEWRTDYEVRRLQAGQVWHERFGWLPVGYVERYEQGQRFNGRWITADQDAAARTGWTVETEHYKIHTNHSLEEGVRLAAKLEAFYRAWKQLFLPYIATPRQVDAMFSGNAARIRLPQHEIVYYRDRGSYLQSLVRRYPQIEQSIGMYEPGLRKAFFHPPEDADGWENVWHEATHQLFQETQPTSPLPGERANFWITEGIATYMESFRTEGDYHILGGWEHATRLRAAAVRLLRDDFYVPLEKFAMLGRPQFKKDPRITMLYSQAAGLTHFLIHGEEGKNRDVLVRYLAAVYAGRDTDRTLPVLAERSFAQLDQAYREFVESGRTALQRKSSED